MYTIWAGDSYPALPNMRVTTGMFTHLKEAQGTWPLINKVESKHIGSLALVYFINNEDKAIAFRLRS